MGGVGGFFGAVSAADFDAAKVAIFVASLVAGAIGVGILWTRARPDEMPAGAPDGDAQAAEIGTPVTAS